MIILTFYHSGINVLVNPRLIRFVYKHDEKTRIAFGNNTDYIDVKETLDQIRNLCNK